MTRNPLRERTRAPQKQTNSAKPSRYGASIISRQFFTSERERETRLHVCTSSVAVWPTRCKPPPVKSLSADARCNAHAVVLRRDLRVHLEDRPVAEESPVQVESVRLGKQKTSIETGRDLHTPLMSGLARPRRHALYWHLVETLRLGLGCGSPASWPPARVEIPSSTQSTTDQTRGKMSFASSCRVICGALRHLVAHGPIRTWPCPSSRSDLHIRDIVHHHR